MDPTAAYARLNDAVRNLDVTRGAEERYVDEVVDAWRALNDWLRDGGFPPAQWGNLTTKPEPIRVKDVDEMLDLLAPDPWRTAANVLGVNVPPTMEDEARAELERRGDA